MRIIPRPRGQACQSIRASSHKLHHGLRSSPSPCPLCSGCSRTRRICARHPRRRKRGRTPGNPRERAASWWQRACDTGDRRKRRGSGRTAASSWLTWLVETAAACRGCFEWRRTAQLCSALRAGGRVGSKAHCMQQAFQRTPSCALTRIECVSQAKLSLLVLCVGHAEPTGAPEHQPRADKLTQPVTRMLRSGSPGRTLGRWCASTSQVFWRFPRSVRSGPRHVHAAAPPVRQDAVSLIRKPLNPMRRALRVLRAACLLCALWPRAREAHKGAQQGVTRQGRSTYTSSSFPSPGSSDARRTDSAHVSGVDAARSQNPLATGPQGAKRTRKQDGQAGRESQPARELQCTKGW